MREPKQIRVLLMLLAKSVLVFALLTALSFVPIASGAVSCNFKNPCSDAALGTSLPCCGEDSCCSTAAKGHPQRPAPLASSSGLSGSDLLIGSAAAVISVIYEPLGTKWTPRARNSELLPRALSPRIGSCIWLI